MLLTQLHNGVGIMVHLVYQIQLGIIPMDPIMKFAYSSVYIIYIVNVNYHIMTIIVYTMFAISKINGVVSDYIGM